MTEPDSVLEDGDSLMKQSKEKGICKLRREGRMGWKQAGVWGKRLSYCCWMNRFLKLLTAIR